MCKPTETKHIASSLVCITLKKYVDKLLSTLNIIKKAKFIHCTMEISKRMTA